jgi:predicted ATPase/DNA-binding CsgD family transcriptional regulator
VASQPATLPPGNLPVELTSFVGRRQELDDLRRALSRARLLTLTGAGGVGKTKLALRAAREVSRQFPHGIWFVELAPVQDPSLVVQAAFATLGLQDRSSGWSTTTLGDFIGDKRALLILDNCEHVLDAAAVLAAALLRACPGLRVLATSRQALGITGEVVIDVPTLSLPDDADAPLAELIRSDAVALFVERASAVQRGFALDDANAAAVLSICSHLDGIALALELAAVRLKALGLEALDHGLTTRLAALGTGDRSASPRQQTLDAAIDWSYQLLNEEERLLWARLSVFVGGFELDAVSAVCGDDRLPVETIADLLGSLVEKSVVKRRDGARGARFRLLEPLRQFGRERLRDHGMEHGLRSRHRDWVMSLAAIAGAGDGRQAEAFQRVKAERANVWAAIGFCLDDPAEAEAGIAICTDLWVYWFAQGPVGDVRRVFDRLLQEVPEGASATRSRGRAVLTNGILAFIQNEYTLAEAGFNEAARIGRETADVDMVSRALTYLASVEWVLGRPAGSVVLADEGLALARSMHLPGSMLHAIVVRAYAVLGIGDLDAAISTVREAVQLSESLGETWERGMAYQLLAGASLARGDLDDAATSAQHSVGFERDLDDRVGMAHTIVLFATIELQRGRPDRTATLLGGSEAIFQSIPSSLMEPFRDRRGQAADAARLALGDRAFDAAYALGLAMTRDEVVDYAREVEATRTRPKTAEPSRSAGPLSRREMEVASLVAEGATNAQVAGSLFISERTVESHLASIFNKLGVDSRLQVARWIAASQVAGPG